MLRAREMLTGSGRVIWPWLGRWRGVGLVDDTWVNGGVLRSYVAHLQFCSYSVLKNFNNSIISKSRLLTL